MTPRILVAGGGTSGHVLPALAIFEALHDAGCPNTDLYYCGARRGVETRLVPPTGVAHSFFEVSGFQRSWRRLGENMSFLPRLISATRQARVVLGNFRPSVVVSVGGYASLPAVRAARRARIPVLVVSYDRRPGRASQYAARRAMASLVAFDDSDLPRAEHVGAPVRREIRRIDRERDRAAARQRLDVPEDRFLVTVMGGSLGSGVLNTAVLAMVRDHADDGSLAIHHVAGVRFVGEVEAARPPLTATGLAYHVVGYEDRMADVYAASDLVVGRGGAGTVAEIATVGVPAILVPWSGAADDHQTGNVRWLSDSDAAVLMSEDAVEYGLGAMVSTLRADQNRLERLARNARRLGDLNRRAAVADAILRVARSVHESDGTPA
jgi:UDP-N-acetylglucosamine--N-acetylmuramyl-(pentapeptide) pyrophosphoryl-undecaprenol N-acetylglucosamine transferase